jgi:hypothetical protein
MEEDWAKRYVYEKRWLERLKQDPSRKDVLERWKEKRRRCQKRYYQKMMANPEKHKKYLEWHKEWRKKNPEKMKKSWEKYYSKHREEKLERQKQYARRLKLEVLTHYSVNGEPHCACCGEKRIEFLCIDHIEGVGGGRRRTRMGTRFYQWLKKNGFPSGYQVLCFNCNVAKAFYGICPHKREDLPITAPYVSKLGEKHKIYTPEELLDR